jgi:signal transduction histidine kinase
LRATLASDRAGPISIYIEDLNLNEFDSPTYEDSVVGFLKVKYQSKPVGVVLAFGASAYHYALRLRSEVRPEAQVVFTTVDEVSASRLSIPAGVTGSFIQMTLRDLLRSARVIVPDLKRIAVVGDPLERQTFYRHFSEELPQIASELQVIDLTGLPMEQLLQRISTLPDQTAIVYIGIYVGGSGTAFIPADALALIAKTANRPIVVDVDSYLGRGAVGGYMLTATSVGEQAARLVLRVLDGESASTIPISSSGVTTPIFDWRELQRWNVSESRLPPGSEIRFRQLTAWDQYRWQIVTGVTLCVVESFFIILLLENRRRLRREHADRQRAEQEAHELAGKLINAQEAERSRLARELHDDVTQRLAVLAIDASRSEHALDSGGSRVMRSMREGLIRLSEDVHALSYRLHPSMLADLGLAEALRIECDQFALLETIEVDVKTGGIPNVLPSAVALCLFRVVQEALRNVARHARANVVQIHIRRRGHELELVVRDDGAGFDSTSSRSRAYLGLASMAQRVHLLQGEFRIESSPGRGTMIIVRLPTREDLHEQAARLVS